jgi:hypothetical protein
VPPSKSGNSIPFAEGRRGNLQYKNLQRVTFLAYPSLKKTAGAPVEKKVKTPITGA